MKRNREKLHIGRKRDRAHQGGGRHHSRRRRARKAEKMARKLHRGATGARGRT